jgi:hypothetical protein
MIRGTSIDGTPGINRSITGFSRVNHRKNYPLRPNGWTGDEDRYLENLFLWLTRPSSEDLTPSKNLFIYALGNGTISLTECLGLAD